LFILQYNSSFRLIQKEKQKRKDLEEKTL